MFYFLILLNACIEAGGKQTHCRSGLLFSLVFWRTNSCLMGSDLCFLVVQCWCLAHGLQGLRIIGCEVGIYLNLVGEVWVEDIMEKGSKWVAVIFNACERSDGTED